MTREEALDIIRDDLVKHFEIEPESITLDAQLVDDLDLDSIDGVDMMVRMQERTGRKVSAEQFVNIRTIDDLVDLMARLAS
ncbi:MAG: acyl carrier protein [Gammaproteobacteria bacterium]|nr:MAG: acyl carrier protein [Gammaproteobacteria bacterium]